MAAEFFKNSSKEELKNCWYTTILEIGNGKLNFQDLLTIFHYIIITQAKVFLIKSYDWLFFQTESEIFAGLGSLGIMYQLD